MPLRELTLLRIAIADIFAFQLVFSRAEVAAADHRLASAQLPSRDQTHRSAPRTRHHGYKRVLSMTQRRLVFQDENRAGVHPFRDPFFQKLQVG